VTNRKLGLLFEAKLGAGKLLVCSIDLQNGIASNPVARQLRHSLLDYMASAKFNPQVTASAEQIRSLIAEPPLMQKLGAHIVKCSSAQPGFEPEHAIDGDPATLWHTSWEEPTPGFPHELQISFAKPTHLTGFTVLPRQDKNKNGWIQDYEFYVSDNGTNWGSPIAKGTFEPNASLKRVMLEHAVEAKFIRFVAMSGYANGPWASVAELEIMP